MFDIGFWEMAFIAVIALVIIGPERLPGAAHRVGIWVGKSKRMLNEVMSDMKQEMKEYDIAQIKTLGSELKSASEQLKDIPQSTSDALGLKEVAKVGSEFKESIAEASSTSSSAQKISKKGKITTAKTTQKKPQKKTKRKPITKTAIKKAATRKKTATKTTTKTSKKTARKRPAKKAASAKSKR